MKKLLIVSAAVSLLTLGQNVFEADALSTVTAVGLEWVSPAASKYQSPNDMLDYFTEDYIYLDGEFLVNDGYRFATDVELKTLYDWYDLYEAPLSVWNESNNPVPEWEQFFSDFDITFAGWQAGSGGYYADQPRISGFVADADVAGKYYWYGFQKQHVTGTRYELIDGVLYSEPFENWSYWTRPVRDWAPYTSATSSGSWIVRDLQPIPEPSTLLLLASGLVGLGMYSRRKKR